MACVCHAKTPANGNDRFMGNGRTQLEYDPKADLAYYLKR